MSSKMISSVSIILHLLLPGILFSGSKIFFRQPFLKKKNNCFEIFGFRKFIVVATVLLSSKVKAEEPYENDQQFKWNSENLISYSKDPGSLREEKLSQQMWPVNEAKHERIHVVWFSINYIKLNLDNTTRKKCKEVIIIKVRMVVTAQGNHCMIRKGAHSWLLGVSGVLFLVLHADYIGILFIGINLNLTKYCIFLYVGFIS